MLICFRRHGEWDTKTGDLTLSARQQALGRRENYDFTFSSLIWRCIETARFLSKGEIQTNGILSDVVSLDGFWSRAEYLRNFFLPFTGRTGRILVVSHSNLISCIKLLFMREKFPKRFEDLPKIQNLEGFDIYI